MLFCSENQMNRHERDTDFVIRERLIVNSVIAFNMYIRDRCDNYYLLSVYAPIKEKIDMTKDSFYHEVERVITTIPKQDNIMM